jgi:hypothetical protein
MVCKRIRHALSRHKTYKKYIFNLLPLLAFPFDIIWRYKGANQAKACERYSQQREGKQKLSKFDKERLNSQVRQDAPGMYT